MAELTHFNEQGRAHMVDVTEKNITKRRAEAAGEIHVSREIMEHIQNGTMKKGDVLAVAQVAGIQAGNRGKLQMIICGFLAQICKIVRDFLVAPDPNNSHSRIC